MPAEAVKVILEKETAFNEEGEPDGFQEFTRRTLEALHFETIAEYGYYLAGEVAEADLASFQRGAATLELMYEIRRDFDLIQINGYTFSSFGQPTGLPEGLVLTEYEGDVGMYLVQFKAPMTPNWWRALTAAGKVVAYYPENTFLVRARKGDMPVLRLVNGVQHVSLFQPAYKVRRSLLTRDEVVTVDVEFDGDQDLDTATTAIRGILDEDVRTDRIGRFAYARLRAALANRASILRRPEVTWVEPALGIEFSGERAATVVLGRYDTLTPPEEPDRYPGTMGYQQWLLDKGFCVPSVDSMQCMAYWSKIAVLDSGLDHAVCTETGYNTATGECSEYHEPIRRHADLNHNANHANNCSLAIPTLDPLIECSQPVITGSYFCSGDAGQKHCYDEGLYHFTDTQLHGTSVASVISGDPWSDDGTNDLDPLGGPGSDDFATLIDLQGFYRGVGVAPSSRLIISKINENKAENQTQTENMTHLHFKNLINEAANLGARFATNSWNLYAGYTDPLPPYPYSDQYSYTTFSKIADYLVRDANNWGGEMKEMTIVFSAGNWEKNPINGPPSYVTSPANAKNVISVGASRGWAVHPDSAMSYVNPDPDGSPWPTEVICAFEDQEVPYHISDVAGLSFGNDQPDMHSRRGFIHELGSGGANPRYKPDLVAPGTHLSAARSRSFLSSPYLYQCFGGTSAAAPLVTGSAVLAEAWYWHRISQPMWTQRPSPAMIKAMLIARADDLHGGKDRIENPPVDLEHSPSLPQGWGRVNLGKLFQTEEPIRNVVVYDQDHRRYPIEDPEDDEPERRFTSSGQYWQVSLKVDDDEEDVIIVMVYTDRFAEPAAQSLTVNDLNLYVYQLGLNQASTRTYWGNYFGTDGYSLDPIGPMSETPYDHVNTVEVIRIKAGELLPVGFRVKVTGATISQKAVPGLDVFPDDLPNQDFALYVYNAKPNTVP